MIRVCKFLFINLIAFSVYAEKIEVIADTPKPVKAYGIIFNSNGSKIIKETSVKEIANQQSLISFAAEDIEKNSFASAIIITDDGSKYFANVKNIGAVSFSDLKSCKEETKITANLSSQKSILEELVNVRKKIRDNNKNVIQSELDDETIERLQKLEEKLGLIYSKPFNTNLSTYDLRTRLFKILSALQN